MNRIITTVVAVCAALAVSAADWLGKVSDCAKSPETLKQTIGTIPAEEQDDFLAAVNEAIAALPGSDEVKAAMFLDANRAAVLGASKEARTAVLAEVYATVPPEYLTVINEEFAKNPFNRNADPSKPISNEKYTEISTGVLAKISERCATAADGNGAVRAAFAALMFERAANGQEGIRDALVAQLPATCRETAKSEWFPAAMGEGREKTYDPMLGISGAGEEPDHDAVLNLSSSPRVLPSQMSIAMLSDIRGADDNMGMGGVMTISPHVVGTADIGINRTPRAAVLSKTPVGLVPVKGLDGKVATDADGNPLFYGPDGEVVTRIKDNNGDYIYVDSNGNVVTNPYYNKKRGDSGKQGYTPQPSPKPQPEPGPYDT